MSSKPTAASFSFGQKHKHMARFGTDGPGPSAYDITGLSVKGTKIEERKKNETKKSAFKESFVEKNRIFILRLSFCSCLREFRIGIT